MGNCEHKKNAKIKRPTAGWRQTALTSTKHSFPHVEAADNISYFPCFLQYGYVTLPRGPYIHLKKRGRITQHFFSFSEIHNTC